MTSQIDRQYISFAMSLGFVADQTGYDQDASLEILIGKIIDKALDDTMIFFEKIGCGYLKQVDFYQDKYAVPDNQDRGYILKNELKLDLRTYHKTGEASELISRYGFGFKRFAHTLADKHSLPIDADFLSTLLSPDEDYLNGDESVRQEYQLMQKTEKANAEASARMYEELKAYKAKEKAYNNANENIEALLESCKNDEHLYPPLLQHAIIAFTEIYHRRYPKHLKGHHARIKQIVKQMGWTLTKEQKTVIGQITNDAHNAKNRQSSKKNKKQLNNQKLVN